MALSLTHRRAPKVLARGGQRGVAELLMLAQGFAADMLAHLILVGFATAPGN
jgi:hypothetical protein